MNLSLIDTHCHIQFADYNISPEIVIKAAETSGVTRIICVGCTLNDSSLAVKLSEEHPSIYASVGIHPHEATAIGDNLTLLKSLAQLVPNKKVIAIGECGLDYYRHEPSMAQTKLLEYQIELALKHDLPLIFHVREAFEDFWSVIDNFKGVRGVVHSFSATIKELDQTLSRGLYIGLNGIVTFSRDEAQIAAAKAVPLDKLFLETDAPYLTPTPYRGKVNESKYVRVIAEFLCKLRGEPLAIVASATTRNAKNLFNIK